MKGRQSTSDPSSNGRDRGIMELTRELEETKFAKERLEVNLRSVSETSENRKRALDDALAKLQEKKQQLEKQSQELNRKAEEIDATNQKYEEIRATLLQKETAFRGVNSAHEQLRVRFNEMQKRMENENRELARALDNANAKCEDQERGMRKNVGEIENLKSVIANLQKKCSNAEAVAEEKMNTMRQLESEIQAKSATLAVFSENKSHYDVLKMKLAECERSLAHESAQRASAERALEKLRNRDGHLLKVEKEHDSVQEQLKWRNEQFELLEDAYKKLQKQFQDGKVEWEREKMGLVCEISTLQANLEAQSRLSKDLQSQLQRCNQALAHEESRRKVLEIQVEESRYGFEKVAADFENARSVIESLTDKSSKEVGLLRDSLASRERQIREMELKQIHMEQENLELKNIVEEFQASKSSSEEMHGSLDKLKLKYTSMEQAYKECCETLKTKETQSERERDEILNTLNDCQTDLRSKDGRVKELESQLEGARASAERLICQRAELSQRLLILESEYQEVQSKMNAENLNLESSYKRRNEEAACLKEQLEVKQKAFEQIQQELTQHQRTIQAVSEKCESLEALELECLVMREDLKRKQGQIQSLSKAHDILQDQILKKEEVHSEEIQKVSGDLEEASASLRAKEQREIELQNELRRLHERIEKTQATNLALEIKAEEYQHQLQALQHEMSQAIHALALSEEKNKTDKESFIDVIKVRDRKIEDLKDQMVHLEHSLNGLTEQEENWLELQSQYKQLTDQRARDLESLSIANAKLESIAKQLLDKEQEKDALLKRLEIKESDLSNLKKEIEGLSVEKIDIIKSIKVQEEKFAKLVLENEQTKTALQQACAKLEVADSELADRDTNIAKLQQQVKHLDVLCKELSNAEGKLQQLENLLEEARLSCRCKEERILECEITVEQLRNEVVVAKLELVEKEKDSAVLEGKLRDSEKESRAKEDKLIKMESNINSVLRESKEKQAEILCLRDEMKEMEKRLHELEERHALDMEAQLNTYRAMLEEKLAALNAAEMEIQRERVAHDGAKDVVEQLKYQLSIEEKACFEMKLQIEYLSKELEISKAAGKQSAESLKELQCRLEDLEQESQDQIRKLQESIFELQHELADTCIKNGEFEMASKCANEELASCNEKCAALEQLLSTKDEALMAKEREISYLHTDISQQADTIGKGQLDLQECKHELEKLNSIQHDYEISLETLCNRNACISHLQENLRLCQVQLEALNVAARNHEQVVSDLLQKLHISEGKIKDLENQCSCFQGAFEVAADSFEKETNDVLTLSHAFDELKSVLLDIKRDTVSGLKDSIASVAEFKNVLISGSTMQTKQMHVLAKTVKDLESQLAEWKNKADSSAEVAEYMQSELENARRVISNLQVQLDEHKSIQECLKEVETSTLSSADINELQKDVEKWKAMVMSASEETERANLQLKLSEENVKVLSSNVEAYEKRQCYMEKQFCLLEEDIRSSLSGLRDEFDKFFIVCNSIGEQDTQVENLKQETLLNHKELRAMLSVVGEELKSFESLMGQFQSYDIKFQTMIEQLSVLQSVDEEREKANLFAKSMEEAEINLAMWKDKVDITELNNNSLQEELELLKRSVDGLRKDKKEGMIREIQLQDEISAMQESLQILNSNFVLERERANSLSYSTKSMGEERDSLLEKIRAMAEENNSTKLEIEAARMQLSQLSQQISVAGEHIENLEEINQKLKCELSAAHEEIQSRRDLVHKLSCHIYSIQVQDISLQADLQSIQGKLSNNWDEKGVLLELPKKGAISMQDERDAIDDSKLTYASGLPSDKMGAVQSTDETFAGSVVFQQLKKSKENRTSLTEEKVHELMNQLEAALRALVGKNATIEKLNKEVENMQTLVKRLEQRNNQLEQYKDSCAIDPERYFHYTELCNSLIRDQIRLKKKLEIAERKNQALLDQIEEFQQTMHAGCSLEQAMEDTPLHKRQDENLICTPKSNLQTDVGGGHGTAERSPLQVLNC